MTFIHTRRGLGPRPPATFRTNKRKPRFPRLRRQASLVGVVLAGGLSSRMGRDKAGLRLHDENVDLLARTVGLLQDVCGRAIVVGREQAGYACVKDAAPGCGPVGGIATALDHCEGAACLVLSCDLPFMNRDILERLVDWRNRRPPGKHVTAWRKADDGKLQPLAAIYEPECLPHFQICVNERLLKISRVVPWYQWEYIEYGEEDELAFFNLNAPADLEVARRLLRLSGERERAAIL
jgi:molybdopterin-guanine dinucleotide biosynthesis protein A